MDIAMKNIVRERIEEFQPLFYVFLMIPGYQFYLLLRVFIGIYSKLDFIFLTYLRKYQC